MQNDFGFTVKEAVVEKIKILEDNARVDDPLQFL